MQEFNRTEVFIFTQQFKAEIHRRKTADHPGEQLETAELVLAQAQDAKAQGISHTFTYPIEKPGAFTEQRVIQPKIEGLKTIVRALRRAML